MKQVRFLQTIPNLVFLEYDTWLNYANCKYKGKFSKHYRKIPWARVITSGYTHDQKLKSEGFDTVFVPKGYDSSVLRNLGVERDIPMGFIGNTKHKAYRERKKLIDILINKHNLFTGKTNNLEEYNKLLNRIRFFISADINFGEYMQKNFEAMACGCVVFAWDQGEQENRALGFKDMENIVLYRSENENNRKNRIIKVQSNKSR